MNIRKKILLLFVTIIFLFIKDFFGQSTTVIYVSPNGNDNNTGSLIEPLASFSGAVEKVKEIKSSGSNVTVLFRGGNYSFKETVILGKEDSGSDSQIITYAAYPGEQPVFTSGIKLTNWKKIDSSDPNYNFLPDDAKQNVYYTESPGELGLVCFLADRNSNWLEPGKINVTQFVTTKKYVHGHSVEGQMWDPPEEKKIATFSKSLANLSNVDSALTFSIYTADFELQILPVEKIEDNKLITATPGGHRLALPDMGQRHGSNELAFIHNLVEGIDTPGKWACYPEIGKIYLWPNEDTSKIYAPSLNGLILIEGAAEGSDAWFSTSKENPVKNIIFNGITFTNCKQPVWLDGDMAAQHDWAMLDKDNALIRFRGAENCVVKNCTFEKSGGAGIAFDLYAKNNIIENNFFRYLGYEGIRLAGYGIGLKDDNKFNTVSRNEIHDVNKIHKYGAALVLWNTGYNSVVENYFHHFTSRAILFSAPRSRAFTKNNQEFFPSDQRMHEQGWPMARWFEIPDSALATIYYATEEENGEEVKIRRVEVNGIKQGDPLGGIADRTCSFFRYLRGNIVERNVIGYGAEELFADGIFYITACANGEPNKIRNNYIFNTGKYLPHPNIPFRLIYIDGYTGKFEFTQNYAYNCKFRFEVTAIYNWWDEVENHSNIFYNVEGEEYGSGNLCVGEGNNEPQKEYINDYNNMIQILENHSWNGPTVLPGKRELLETLRSTIVGLEKSK